MTQLLGRRRNPAALDQTVADEAWKLVFLLRLSPLIPFNLQNYLFGVTAIPFRQYVAATFVGIIPGAALYTYIGTLGNAAQEGGPAKWAFSAAGTSRDAYCGDGGLPQSASEIATAREIIRRVVAKLDRS
jgi:uncharacterized membrane protein YdjX (TVP38/TMEM64 family)